jgi:hypothetical protein
VRAPVFVLRPALTGAKLAVVAQFGADIALPDLLLALARESSASNNGVGLPKTRLWGKILLGEGRDLENVGLMEDRRRDNS